jgi:hypothetical protein
VSVSCTAVSGAIATSSSLVAPFDPFGAVTPITSMMFITPIPATSSEIAETSPSSVVNTLLEAVLISLFGGIVGVAAGVVGSQFKIAGVQPSIVPYSIGLAFGAWVLIGLFFGTYPAGRAAAMRPIEALRFE